MASSRNVSPSKRHIKDPHAGLDLFSTRATDENERILSPNAVAPRASAKPVPREMSELFAAGHEDNEPGSPKKLPVEPVMAPKGGGNQRFSAPRLFSDADNEPTAVGYKSNHSKYNHFDMGDPNEHDTFQFQEPSSKAETAVPMRPRSNKGQSQWDFADLATPPKVNQKVRGQDVVHFSIDSAVNDLQTPAKKVTNKPRRDNETHFDMQDAGTPVQHNVVPKPRKDADTHFQFKDVASPAPNRDSGRPASSSGRMGLYSNAVFDEDEESTPREKAPLAPITNNAAHRRQDFDSHWGMGNQLPADRKPNDENKPISNHSKQSSHQMETHWATSDGTPEQVKKVPDQGRLRKGQESNWSMGGGTGATGTNGSRDKAQKSFWDF